MGELLEFELLVFVDVNVTLVCIKGPLDVLNCFLQKCDEIKFFDKTIFFNTDCKGRQEIFRFDSFARSNDRNQKVNQPQVS